LKENIFQGTLITRDVHIDFIPLGIFGFVYDFISFVMFCFGFLFAMGFFPNTVVGPWEVLVMYGANRIKRVPVVLQNVMLYVIGVRVLNYGKICSKSLSFNS